MRTPSDRTARQSILWAAFVACSLPVQAAYVITPFDVPGSQYPVFDEQNSGFNLVQDISDNGKLVGITSVNDRTLGFFYDSGVLTLLTGPTIATTSRAFSVSNSGVVVGTWDDDRTGRFGGFLYSAGSYQSLTGVINGQMRNILPDAISANGRYVTGTYGSAAGLQAVVLDRNTSSYSPLGLVDFYPQDINNAGQIVGHVVNASGKRNVVHDVVQGTTVDIDLPGVNAFRAMGINDAGQIGGTLERQSGVQFERAFIGTMARVEQTFAVGGAEAARTVGHGINNLGQLAGGWFVEGYLERVHGFFATPAAMPVAGSANGTMSFNLAVTANVPVFIDPVVAVGYEYRIGAGDPLFKTVSLPLGIGDNLYLITVGGKSFEVAGNQLFEFSANGFADGVADFTVTGIETQAMLDPNDPTAFITQLSFASDGRFTGTQRALTLAVPEPGTSSLLALGLLALSLAGVRRRSTTAQPAARLAMHR